MKQYYPQSGGLGSGGIGGWLLRAYPIPDPMDTYEAEQRYLHRDLPLMTFAVLLREQVQVRFVMTFAQDPHPWLGLRLRAIEAEIQRRHGGTRAG